MTISIWRYSHLALFLVSSLFLIAAAFSGGVLSVEPINNEFKSVQNENLGEISLEEFIDVIKPNFDEVISVRIDKNSFVKASVFHDGSSKEIYVNPKTGLEIGEVQKREPLFQFFTNFHRSLFLKTTGRILVGIFSFILFLIVLSGFFLLVKRQGGLRSLFSKVHKDEASSYWHVVLSKWFILPIILVSISGIYLSAERFSLLPSKSTGNEPAQVLAKNTYTLKAIKLNQIIKLEFPFSDDAEDYYSVEHRYGSLEIHQFSGELISLKKLPRLHDLNGLMKFLHTGKGSGTWAVVLLLTSFSVFFFMISGTVIFLKRRAKSKIKSSSEVSKDEAEIIILFGSESGNTLELTNKLYKTLQDAHKKVFLSELNAFTSYENAKHYIVLTSTYGNGEAPTNAYKFERLLKEHIPTHPINFSVIGFGSSTYTNFCSYAVLVNKLLNAKSEYTELLPLVKVDNHSPEQIDQWVSSLNKKLDLSLSINGENKTIRKNEEFTVVDISELNSDDTFTLYLEPKNRLLTFESGDILEIEFLKKEIPRAYSIAKYNKGILLCIKKHQFGLCSSFLADLKLKQIISGQIIGNPRFKLPEVNSSIICIANGTGIAPFLGMLKGKKTLTDTHLFWGTKTPKSIGIYSKYLDELNVEADNLYITYSQTNHKYIQIELIEHKELILNLFKNQGTLLVCGSIKMQEDLFYHLEKLLQNPLYQPLEHYISKGQILTDCY